jgi:ATP phosphoribosyltransferase regulatory subunit
MSLLSSEFGDTDKHIRDLSTVNELLSHYGIENKFFFDFSLTRKIEYYTGLVFEASVPNLGLPIGGGGRYDDFIKKFGKIHLPANGFALEIERCLHALTAQGFKIPKKEKIRILVSSEFDSAAVQAVERLRGRGFVTLIDVTKKDKKKTISSAKLAGINFVLFVGSSLKKLATVYDLQSNTSSRITFEAFTEKLGETTTV